MIQEILTEQTVRVKVRVNDWEDSIRHAGQLLLDNDYIEASYIDNMVNIVKEIGPYIVLIKGVALAHARPEQGAKKIGLSLITLENPVCFGLEENDPVSLVFALSAVDHDSHLDLIGELAQVFEHEENLEKLAACQTQAEVLALIDKMVNNTAA